MNLTYKQYELLLNIFIKKIKTPIYHEDFANAISENGNNNINFKKIKSFLLKEELIIQVDAYPNKKKIIKIDYDKIYKIVRNTSYFKLTEDFIHATDKFSIT